MESVDARCFAGQEAKTGDELSPDEQIGEGSVTERGWPVFRSARMEKRKWGPRADICHRPINRVTSRQKSFHRAVPINL